MELNTKELIAVLKSATSYLEKFDGMSERTCRTHSMPFLHHLYLNGTDVVTFNGKSYFKTSCTMGVEGLLYPHELVRMLACLKTDTVGITKNKNGFKLKYGKNHTTVPVLPCDDHPLKDGLPKPNYEVQIPANNLPDFIEGIKRCSISLDSGEDKSGWSGVTCIPGDKGLMLYSTDGISMSKYGPVDLDLGEDQVIIPSLICKQLTARQKLLDGKSVLLSFSDVYTSMTYDNTTIATMMSSEKVALDFEMVMSKYLVNKPMLFTLPESIKETMRRIQVSISKVDEKAKQIRVVGMKTSGGKLSISTQSGLSITESLDIDTDDETEASFGSSEIKKALSFTTKMGMKDDYAIFEDGKFLHFLAYTRSK